MAEPAVSSRELQCVVVTPERALLDEQADSVVVPLFDGELGIYPGRAPLVGRLGFGELRIKRGGETKRFYIDGGFVQVRANVVTVLTSRALKDTEIDAVKAKATLEEAKQPAADPKKQDERARMQERARAQLRVVEHGTRGGHA